MFIELKTNKGYRLVNIELFSNIYSEPSKEGEVMVFFQFIDRKKEGLFSLTTPEDFDEFMSKIVTYQYKLLHS